MNTSISELIGKTITDIEGLEKHSESVIFNCSDGTRYQMFHDRDCCESVDIEDICGEVSDLIGNPITVAEANTNNENPLSPHDESFTWTFYKLATIKGYLDIRWYGSSNGYYGEEAYFRKV